MIKESDWIKDGQRTRILVIRIVISRYCDELRQVVFYVFGSQVSIDKQDIILSDETDVRKAKQALERVLSERRIEDYIVAENTEDPTELAILKKGDIEQLGLYPCSFCMMVFNSEVERNLHQRVHYFGFA
jgi:hypothetical protein